MESKRRDHLLTLLFLLLTLALFLLPSWKQAPDSAERVKVRVLSTDNSNMRQFGIVRTGDQGLRIRILEGSFRGTETDAVNHLAGRLELDKVFVPGDIAFAVVDADAGRIAKASVLDHYRLDTQLRLLALFCALLLLFGGWTGARALLSFFFTGAMIWKVLLPGYLAGLDPVLISLFTALALTAAIVFLVGGVGRKGTAAFLGSALGILLTCGLSLYFGSEFRIHGAVKPFSETLLYSGFAHLDLTRIFLGGIFLASSGAVMDLAMDVSSAMAEIAEKRPDLSRRQLVLSGFAVGRSVVGTMTTTLLLAYTGSYSSLLLVFVAQGVPLANILNMQYVSAEILHTLVGSFGLVTVAPFTALAGGWLFAGRDRG
ncbi:YibE/F family protein [Aminivibrio sp.]|uniref:YibE/F family protein n=1 Tax=Aminivibrio sp. TaxID=1872489 RepID=UPI00345ED92B